MIPTEDQECIIFADYCRLKGYLFGHINNELFTKSWKQKLRQKQLGSAKGLPDYIVIANNKLFFIEMKRTKGGVVSNYQKQWIEKLKEAGIKADVCYGAKEAINYIEKNL